MRRCGPAQLHGVGLADGLVVDEVEHEDLVLVVAGLAGSDRPLTGPPADTAVRVGVGRVLERRAGGPGIEPAEL
jgi:hypothetical protein